MEAGTLAVSGEAGASGDPRSGTHWAAAAAMTGVPERVNRRRRAIHRRERRGTPMIGRSTGCVGAGRIIEPLMLTHTAAKVIIVDVMMGYRLPLSGKSYGKFVYKTLSKRDFVRCTLHSLK